ncbi:hypothetical protein EHI47_22925 [Rhizobium leguminosarum]|jgi:ribosome-binding protein aMBF1 (putative translation factor)|uniref:Uncharacterized protein n=1 Tax=Rhizobium leguminosarum TaxID=384 RepID=A0A444HTN1_RHILE|nr:MULTISPECIES: hypothetical protein [Rhizobium]NKL61411.1 hypothetical protein [Rhizobium leguminosarum bv. viciae]RWX15835.1 hypothetical protein EHI45_09370 [Rhizobium leguminosarum]RWX26714.1 hypothetical protein EHI47_22925 [Rhizobium leguminosarum]TAU45655.1 hypothetical protein ELI43_25355 [Rhizobium leguminosarum]TBC89649.1 hypothetical protein ELH26_26775 [Rhizobium leguminosarum]
MLDIIIRSALDVVGRTERLVEAMRRLLQSDDLDEVEVYELDYEIERLGDVVFNVDEAVRSLARTVECWSQTDLAHEIRRTLH